MEELEPEVEEEEPVEEEEEEIDTSKMKSWGSRGGRSKFQKGS